MLAKLVGDVTARDVSMATMTSLMLMKLPLMTSLIQDVTKRRRSSAQNIRAHRKHVRQHSALLVEREQCESYSPQNTRKIRC